MVLPFDWAFMSETRALNWTVEDPCRLCDDREVHEQAAVLVHGGWARHTVLPMGECWAVQIRLVRRPPNIVVLERLRRRLFPKQKEGPLCKVCGGVITTAPKQSRYCSDECRKARRREYDRARRKRAAAATMEAAA
ncbi:hypothetical protein HRbin39_01586 [bacterium HR39]|nr:hypothetical protein HRbin39_01586 [bacterium HR39]